MGEGDGSREAAALSSPTKGVLAFANLKVYFVLTTSALAGPHEEVCVMGAKAAFLAVIALVAVWPSGTTSAAGLWLSPVSATNVVVSTPTSGGGYAELPPTAGGCVGPTANNFNANHSESELTVKPGSEQIVGSSKFFFDRFSTNYNFYLGSYNMNGATLSHSNNIVQGYDCSTTETTPGVLNQNMPPSWTNTTDPNVGIDSQGRVYQTMLPLTPSGRTCTPTARSPSRSATTWARTG